MDLKGKHILLIAPDFYGYEKRIVKALEKEGLEVSFEYIFKPTRFVLYISKIKKDYVGNIVKHYYSGIINKYADTTFDYFLLVDGKSVPDYFLKEMIANHPVSLSIYYSWDSLQYFDYLSWLKIFDRVYTFDYKDSREKGIKYLPLFYTPELEVVGMSNEEKIYDLLFIATYKENRLNFINTIVDMYNGKLNIKVVLYLSFYRYIVDLIKGKRIRRKDVVFKPIPFNQYLDLLSKSKVVLDYTPAAQTGLPMRILEAVGARKKIITNNNAVRQEFKGCPNIIVYNEDKDIISFINSDDIEMAERDNYSVSSWIKRILS